MLLILINTIADPPRGAARQAQEGLRFLYIHILVFLSVFLCLSLFTSVFILGLLILCHFMSISSREGRHIDMFSLLFSGTSYRTFYNSARQLRGVSLYHDMQGEFALAAREGRRAGARQHHGEQHEHAEPWSEKPHILNITV